MLLGLRFIGSFALFWVWGLALCIVYRVSGLGEPPNHAV